MARLVLSLLGTFQASLDNQAVTAFESNKVRGLLAYLAVEADRPHARDTLAGLLWSNFSNRDALSNLRYALSNLREAIGDRKANPPFLCITRDAIQFNQTSDFELDVRAWQSADKLSISNLQSLIAVYRGAFLEGFACDSAPFEEWIVLTRERLNQSVLRALGVLIDYFDERGKYDRVESYARKKIEIEPWDEAAHGALMRALAQQGQRSAALAQYDKCRRLLKQELDIEPSRETIALYASIRDGILERRTPHNLPVPLSSFVGRAREMAEVKQLLGTTRLLTLTGAGGCGKTRLALHVAQDLGKEDSPSDLYHDGIWWIDLAPLNNAALVPQTLAGMFDLQESPNQSMLAVLTNYFRTKQALLIFDNCEHLIDACAHVVGVLLSACPSLHFLATSREPLNISGEAIYQVPSMRCPTPSLPLEQLRQYDAIQLFAERARAVVPHWSLVENKDAVTEICARLDGIPLAIELAAARLDRLSAREIVIQLTNRFGLLVAKSGAVLPRHQTFRATMDWSYDLLDEAERELFTRLGVFRGGGTLAAVNALGADAGDISVADRLTLLIDKNLIQRVANDDETRFLMLETIRAYAEEKLNARADAQLLRHKYLEYYMALAEEIEPKLWGAQSLTASALLEKEYGNLATALSWGMSTDAPDAIELSVRLAGALWYYWSTRGNLAEGRHWLERALSQRGVSASARAKTLLGEANLLWQQGEYASARQYFEASIALWRAVGSSASFKLAETQHLFGHLVFDQRDYATARTIFTECYESYLTLGDANLAAILNSDLGLVFYHQGDYTSARGRFQTSLDWFETHGNEQYAAETRERLGDLARLAGDDAKAKADYEKCLDWFQKDKTQLGIASVLHKLAFIAQHRGEYALANRNVLKSLKLQKESGNKQGIAECLAGMAGLAAVTGKLERATRLFGAARGLLDTIGAPLAPADLAEWKRDETIVRTQLDGATFDTMWEAGRAMTLEQAIEYALEWSQTFEVSETAKVLE